MLNRRIIEKINREIATDLNGVVQPLSGLNHNDYHQLKRAINIAEFAKNDYKENLSEEFEDCLAYLLIALSSINEYSNERDSDFITNLSKASYNAKLALDDFVKTVKYKEQMEVLKIRIKELALKEELGKIKNLDINLTSLIDTLTNLLEMNVTTAKRAKDNNLKRTDIRFIDKNTIYLTGNLGTVSVAKKPYLRHKAKNDVKYALNLFGYNVLNGTSKVLKRINK